MDVYENFPLFITTLNIVIFTREDKT